MNWKLLNKQAPEEPNYYLVKVLPRQHEELPKKALAEHIYDKVSVRVAWYDVSRKEFRELETGKNITRLVVYWDDVPNPPPLLDIEKALGSYYGAIKNVIEYYLEHKLILDMGRIYELAEMFEAGLRPDENGKFPLGISVKEGIDNKRNWR